jgi:hypothetical protein
MFFIEKYFSDHRLFTPHAESDQSPSRHNADDCFCKKGLLTFHIQDKWCVKVKFNGMERIPID